MRIYIDESGSFATAEEARNPLSVVVAVAFDEIHIPKIESIINETKKRTLCSSELKIDSFKNGKDFVKFLKILKKYNPTIIIAAANTSEKLVGFYREIRDYDIEHLENESFLCHKTAQQYIQGLIFFDLINASLWALAEKVSKEIEINNKNKYQWIIDEKGKSYENFTKANIAKYTSGIGVNFEYRLIKPPLCALYEKYGSHGNSGLKIEKILEEIDFVDSKEYPGVQIAGIIAGGVRRCLQEKWNDHAGEICSRIGRLMKKQPKWLKVLKKGQEITILPIVDKFEEYSNLRKNKAYEIMKSKAR